MLKKIEKHFTSKTHLNEVKIAELAKNDPLKKSFEKVIKENTSVTEKLLTIAYAIALHNRPYSDYPKLIELCENFGVNFGSSLRNRLTCTRMVDSIANQMRYPLTTKVLNSEALFTLVIDESDNISSVCCLIFYIHSVIDGKSITFFLDLIEVKSRDSISLKKLI